MHILVIKLLKFATTKAAKLGLCLVVLFGLFFACHFLLPRVTNWLKEAEAIRTQQKELENSLASISQQKLTATEKKNSAASLVNDLESTYENLRKQHEERVANQKDLIARRKRERPFHFPRPWTPEYDRQTYIEVKELQLWEATGVAFPNSDRIGQLKADLLNAQSLLGQHDAEISQLDDHEYATRHQLEVSQGKSAMYRELTFAFRKFTPFVVPIVLMYFFGPFIWALFMFYAVARATSFPKPIVLATKPTTRLLWVPPQKLAKISLEPNDKIACRNDWLSQHDGTPKRTKLLWSIRHITVSFAARLNMCTEVTNSTNRRKLLVLGSNDPDTYITEIVLEDTTELVLHARKIVAIRGPIEVRSNWRITSLHAWLTGQLRYLVFTGPGSIFIEGCGGSDGVFLSNETQHLEQQLTVGFDTRLAHTVRRTETFWPYFKGEACLFEDCFDGDGILIRETSQRPKTTNPVERGLSFVFSAIGKLLGL